MNILVTGANGFVGKNLISSLSKKYFFEKWKVRYGNTESYELPNINACAIIHLAGLAHDAKKTRNKDDYQNSNYQLTKIVYDAFLRSEAKLFIYMSSIKAVADFSDKIITEDTACHPQTDYGISKKMAEDYILSNVKPDKRIFILRPCMIYGPGNKGNLNLLVRLIQTGIPWPLASFENKRTFLSVDNLVYVIDKMIENQSIPSGLYNVGDSESLSTNQLTEIIARAKNIKIRKLNLPRWFVQSIAKLGDMMNLPLNSDRLEKLTSNYVVDNSKLLLTIGGHLPVNTICGIEKTIRSSIVEL